MSLQRNCFSSSSLLYQLESWVPERSLHEENAGVRLSREPVWPLKGGIFTGLSWLKKFLSSGHWSGAETFLASAQCSAPSAVLTSVLCSCTGTAQRHDLGWGNQTSENKCPSPLLQWGNSLAKTGLSKQLNETTAREETELQSVKSSWAGSVTRVCSVLLHLQPGSRALPCFGSSRKKQILSCESGHPEVSWIWASKAWVSFGNGPNSAMVLSALAHSFKTTP